MVGTSVPEEPSRASKADIRIAADLFDHLVSAAAAVHSDIEPCGLRGFAWQSLSRKSAVCANYASADGKRRESESYDMKSGCRREGTILVAQSKFADQTVKHERLEHIDHHSEQDPDSDHEM